MKPQEKLAVHSNTFNGSTDLLVQWIKEGMTLKAIAAKLLAEHGIKTSPSQICKWWQRKRKEDEKEAAMATCRAEIDRAAMHEAEFRNLIAPSLATICKPIKCAAMILAAEGLQDLRKIERCLCIVKALNDIQRTERAMCETYVQWRHTEQVEQIMESDLNLRDKVSRLHEVMFGEPLTRLPVEFAN